MNLKDAISILAVKHPEIYSGAKKMLDKQERLGAALFELCVKVKDGDFDGVHRVLYQTTELHELLLSLVTFDDCPIHNERMDVLRLHAHKPECSECEREAIKGNKYYSSHDVDDYLTRENSGESTEVERWVK